MNITSNIPFYMETETHQWLIDQSEDNENAKLHMDNGDAFTFHVTDQPICAAFQCEQNEIRIKLFIRSEVGIFEDSPDLGICIPENHKDIKLEHNSGRIGGNPSEPLMAFLNGGMMLRACLMEQNRISDFDAIDPETEGIFVTVEDSKLKFCRVAGKGRPDMACTTLFGGIEMKRPYMDEITEFNVRDMLPMEEKIQLAEDGDEDMMLDVAMAYLNGDEAEEDPEKAVFWFKKLAELDNSTGQFNLGLHYAKGYGVERDFKKAAYWMQKAADNGDDDAPDLIEEYRKADENLKKAQAGDAQAQADLAGLLMKMAGSLEQAGEGKDYAASVDWAEKSAAQNNGKGIWTLALAYEHGRGVEEDTEKAVELYHRGADLGDAACQHSLGCYYLRGDVVEKDEETGFSWCMKAAEQGYGLAMKAIGTCYQFGNGVDDDMQEAIKWYEKALEDDFDPELAQKVQLFKMLEQNGGFDGMDDENSDDSDSMPDLPAGYEEAMDIVMLAEELGYEEPDDCKDHSIQGQIDFVAEKAKAGNLQAKYIAARYFIANDEQKELGEQWLKEAIEAGYEEE